MAVLASTVSACVAPASLDHTVNIKVTPSEANFSFRLSAVKDDLLLDSFHITSRSHRSHLHVQTAPA